MLFRRRRGQHACRVAERLGLTRIVLHPLAGVLSAYGMGLADFRVVRERAVVAPLEEALMPTLADCITALKRRPGELRAQGVTLERIVVRRRIMLRYAGTDTALPVDFGALLAMRADFEAAHRQRFGFVYEDKPLLAEAAAVEAIGLNEPRDPPWPSAPGPARRPEPMAVVPMYTGGRHHETPVYRREQLGPGAALEGPAIVIEPTSTTVVEPGWAGAIAEGGALVLRRVTAPPPAPAGPGRPDPVRLEIFNRLFMSVAEEMGQTLQNTAHSVNIKERLDFSCALFDGAGELVANAPTSRSIWAPWGTA